MTGAQQRNHVRLIGPLLVGVFLLVGCSPEVSRQSEQVGWPTETYRLVVSGEQVAFAADIPDELHVTRIDEHDWPPLDCAEGVRYVFSGDLVIESFAQGCAETSQQIGNGVHGYYRSLEDVPAPLHPEEVETALGPAHVFDQEYFECTNICEEWQEPVAIIELDRPRDENYPALVLRSDKAALDREVLVGIMETMRPQ